MRKYLQHIENKQKLINIARKNLISENRNTVFHFISFKVMMSMLPQNFDSEVGGLIIVGVGG